MVADAQFFNRTRRSQSIPMALLRRGHLPAIPLYYVLRLSTLAREGFENSGSYRFADHIYRGIPSGRGVLGRWIDGRLLAMPAVRSFRNRFVAARDTLLAFLQALPPERNVRVLSVPCGIPRELVEAATHFRAQGGRLDHVHFCGIDLDPQVLDTAQRFAGEHGIDLSVRLGNALDADTYHDTASFVTSTGFGEFLDDARLEHFYRIVCTVLEPSGLFVTTAMQKRAIADYLLRIAEIDVHYRGAGDLQEIARRAGFAVTVTTQDEHGIQTIMTARK
jgi:hypothetical protein